MTLRDITFVEPLLFSPSRRWAGAVALAHAGVLVVSSSFALRALLMTADSSAALIPLQISGQLMQLWFLLFMLAVS